MVSFLSIACCICLVLWGGLVVSKTSINARTERLRTRRQYRYTQQAQRQELQQQQQQHRMLPPYYSGKGKASKKSDSSDYDYDYYYGDNDNVDWPDYHFPEDGRQDDATTAEDGDTVASNEGHGATAEGALDSSFSVPTMNPATISSSAATTDSPSSADTFLETTKTDGDFVVDNEDHAGVDEDTFDPNSSFPMGSIITISPSTITPSSASTDAPSSADTFAETTRAPVALAGVMSEPPSIFEIAAVDTDVPTKESVSGRDENIVITAAPAQETSSQNDFESTGPPATGTANSEDVVEIQDANADINSPTNQTNNEPAISDSITAEFCEDVPADKTVNLTWIYAVEFRPAVSAVAMDAIINVLELQLVSELLTCNDASRNTVRRRLLLEGVAGLNYMPRDTQRKDELCLSNQTIGGICNTYNGLMQLYLEESVNKDIAINDMRFQIQAVMTRNGFPVLPEVVRVWYVGPEISTVSEISSGGNSSIRSQQSGNELSTGGVVAFASLGFFVLGALILGMYRVRGRNLADDGTSTMKPESEIMTGTLTATQSPKISPFTAMLPKAYNLHDPDNMSAIIEGDSDSESRASQGSVILSDGGFTTDGEESTLDGSANASSKFQPVLGTHKLDEEGQNDSALLFEDDNDIPSCDNMAKQN